MHLHDLPLAALEVENVGAPRFELLFFPCDDLLDARPPNGPFLPGLDLDGGDREGAQLFDLLAPEGVCLRALPPLIRIGADYQRAGVLR